MKIILGTTETSGYNRGLYKGIVECGVECFFAELTEHSFQYKKTSTDNIMTKLCRFSDRKYKKTGLYFWKKVHKYCRKAVFEWALKNFDAFILIQDAWFNDISDLKVIKEHRKLLMVICLGTPSRLPYSSGKELIVNGKEQKASRIVQNTKIKLERIKQVEKYADYYINAPAQAQLNNTPFISHSFIGLPVSITGNKKAQTQKSIMEKKNGPVRIVHAPSDSASKGSDIFKGVISKLKLNYNIEYIELKGVSNEQVLFELQKCDFVLDEMYSDMPMAGLGTEAAWFGKPTLTCGYFANRVKEFYQPDLIPPSLYVMPEDLEKALTRLLEDVDFRRELGKKAYKFVHTKWSPKVVAEKVLRVLYNEAPLNWYVDPKLIAYPYGGGVSKQKIAKCVKEIINQYGTNGLQLNQNTMLMDAFVELSIDETLYRGEK